MQAAVTPALLALLLLTASPAPAAEPPACREPAHPLSPRELASPEAAEAFVKRAFAGGAVSMGEVEGQQVMFVLVHGSGVPSLYLAAYTQSGSGWVRAAEVPAVPPLVQSASVRGATVVVLSGKDPQCVMRVVQYGSR